MEVSVNKTELINRIAEAGGMTKAQARPMVELFMDVAENELRQRGVFAIHDLVKIEVVDVPARSGESMGIQWSKPAGKKLRAKIIGKAKRMFES